MLKDFSLKLPRTIFSGENPLNNLTAIVEKEAVKTAVIFTDKSIEKLGLLTELLAILNKAHVHYQLLTDLPAEPSCDEAQKVVEDFKALGGEMIIAVGGGSVMDVAKLASILVKESYTVRDLLANPLLGKKSVPTLMIPTTAGTGAEATPNSIVSVPEKELKIGIVNPELIPDYVILDGKMIQNLPRKIAAATGVDALCHAIECFTSNKANPFSDTFALRALDLIWNNLVAACDSTTDLAAKNKMLMGSFFAGIAITSSGTTAVHALSYPLGGKYHIPHGVSNAILLGPVMRYNEPAIAERLAEAYDAVVHDGNRALTTAEKAQYMIHTMEALVKHLDIPTSLQDFGVPKEDLEGLVKAGMEVQRLLVNNMRVVTAADARQIYLEIM